MDRKDVLLEARSRFEGPIWSLLAKVEETLVDLVSVRHLDLFSLGLNCATGPTEMYDHLLHLSRRWNGHIACLQRGVRRVDGDH